MSNDIHFALFIIENLLPFSMYVVFAQAQWLLHKVLENKWKTEYITITIALLKVTKSQKSNFCFPTIYRNQCLSTYILEVKQVDFVPCFQDGTKRKYILRLSHLYAKAILLVSKLFSLPAFLSSMKKLCGKQQCVVPQSVCLREAASNAAY